MTDAGHLANARELRGDSERLERALDAAVAGYDGAHQAAGFEPLSQSRLRGGRRGVSRICQVTP
jgi:hypothetical protein